MFGDESNPRWVEAMRAERRGFSKSVVLTVLSVLFVWCCVRGSRDDLLLLLRCHQAICKLKPTAKDAVCSFQNASYTHLASITSAPSTFTVVVSGLCSSAHKALQNINSCSPPDRDCTSAERLLFATRCNFPLLHATGLTKMARQTNQVTSGGCKIWPLFHSGVRLCNQTQLFIAYLGLIHFTAKLANLSCSIFITSR